MKTKFPVSLTIPNNVSISEMNNYINGATRYWNKIPRRFTIMTWHDNFISYIKNTGKYDCYDETQYGIIAVEDTRERAVKN